MKHTVLAEKYLALGKKLAHKAPMEAISCLSRAWELDRSLGLGRRGGPPRRK